jgi:ATP-dependent RNA helicase DDX49/DBP8
MSSDSGSDRDISEHQLGSRKRRKLSQDGNESSESDSDAAPAVPVPTPAISRVKAKRVKTGTDGVTATEPARVTASEGARPQVSENTTFASINVAPWLIASLSALEIKRPTAIQKACIPEILKGRDCIGGSRTGTGKTIAFAVPILQKLFEDPMGIYAVVIT